MNKIVSTKPFFAILLILKFLETCALKGVTIIFMCYTNIPYTIAHAVCPKICYEIMHNINDTYYCTNEGFLDGHVADLDL